MHITVYELIDLFLDEDIQQVKIFSLFHGEYVYAGTLDNMPTEIQNKEVASIDNLDDSSILTINVE